MKKILLLVCTLLFSGSLIGQSQDSDGMKKDKSVFKSMQNDDVQPVFIMVIDTVEYRMKNFRKSDFDPDWIHSIEVLKDDASNKRYDSKYGVVKIRVKKAFARAALKVVEKEKNRSK